MKGGGGGAVGYLVISWPLVNVVQLQHMAVFIYQCPLFSTSSLR